jgi:DNA-binding MarR family transcriptional regulator
MAKLDDTLNYSVWKIVTQVADILLLAREMEVKPYEITSVQAKVLGLLTNSPKPVTIASLARRLQKKHNGVAALVDRMKRNDLLYELKDIKKTRNRMIAVTDKGRSIYEETKDINIISEILSPLSDSQKEEIIKVMTEIRNNAVQQLHANDFYLVRFS